MVGWDSHPHRKDWFLSLRRRWSLSQVAMISRWTRDTREPCSSISNCNGGRYMRLAYTASHSQQSIALTSNKSSTYLHPNKTRLMSSPRRVYPSRGNRPFCRIRRFSSSANTSSALTGEILIPIGVPTRRVTRCCPYREMFFSAVASRTRSRHLPSLPRRAMWGETGDHSGRPNVQVIQEALVKNVRAISGGCRSPTNERLVDSVCVPSLPYTPRGVVKSCLNARMIDFFEHL